MRGLQVYYSDSEFSFKYENQLRYPLTSINHCLAQWGPNFTFIHRFKDNVIRWILNLKFPPMAVQKKKFLLHLVSFINVEGKMSVRDMKIWKWIFDESSSPALPQYWTYIPTWLRAILLVYSLQMRSNYRSLRAHIAVDCTRSTASVSASAHDYKGILHTCNPRGHAAPKTENECEKKKSSQPEGYRHTGQNTDGEIFQGEKRCSVTWRQGASFALLTPTTSAQFSLTTDV